MKNTIDFNAQAQFINAVKDYLDILNEKLTTTNRTASVVDGRKYYKVVVQDTNGTNKSVHSFIDRSNGDLYKAASWFQPAKGARYNLLTDIPMLKKDVDPFGGYLYLRGVR